MAWTPGRGRASWRSSACGAQPARLVEGLLELVLRALCGEVDQRACRGSARDAVDRGDVRARQVAGQVDADAVTSAARTATDGDVDELRGRPP